MMQSESLVPLADAARVVGVPYHTLYQRWLAGKLPYEKRGAYILVRWADVKKNARDYRPQQRRNPVVLAAAE